MFCFIIAVIYAILFIIVGLPVLGIVALIGLFSKKARDTASMKIIQWAFRVLLRITGTTITVKGLENIPNDQACLFIGNHRSIFDIIATYPYMKRPGGYVAKMTMKKIPIFNIWMHFIYCLFVDRDDLKSGMHMILDAVKQVKGGRNIWIFPEGTRNKQEKDLPLLEFHEGSFRVATKTGCPIIPVAINNTIQIWEAHMPKAKPTHIVIEFCRPLYPKDFSKEEKKRLGAYTRDLLTKTIEKNQSLV